MPAITMKNVSYTYAGCDTPSLSNVSLEIQEGEFVVVAGPSGCGKSTLCRCLNGLVPHFYEGTFNGQVIVDGLRVADHAVAEMAERVGMVFQDPESQLFSLSVESEVAFGPENLGLPRQEILKRLEDSMSRAEIRHLRDRMPFEISGGEQQKVAMAATLAMHPSILVMDEPTSNLDPQGAFTLLRVVGELNKHSGKTVVIVEHRLEAVTGYADRMILMEEGRIVADDNPRSVLASDVAARLGVGIPRITELFLNLKSEGLWGNSSIPLTVEEGVHHLAELLN